MTRLRHLAGLLVFATALGAGASSAKDAAPPSAPIFLSQADVELGLALPPPPADGSRVQKREMAELHSLERARTPKGWARARWDDTHESGEIFAGALGPWFVLSSLPATSKLLADVRHEEKIAAKRAKVHFARGRPWIVDPSLSTCSREDGPLTSYPSGHTVMGYSMAVVLAAAVPQKSRAIMARADEYARNRLVCAMHFRSDIMAGKTLGIEIGQALLAKPAFAAEVRAAAAELRPHR